MSYNKLAEHARYVSDSRRAQQYREALSRVVTSESVVLDLGSGTGILGLLAASAGARRVYAVEEGPIASIASQVIRESGYGDVITVIGASSLTVELPEMVDLVVCDQLFGVAIEADMPNLLADAKARHLKPGGVLMPQAFSLAAVPVSAPWMRRRLETLRAEPYGFNFKALADATINTPALHSESQTEPVGKLAPVLGPVDSHSLDVVSGSAEFVVDKGVVDGIQVSWTAELTEGVELTNQGSGSIDRTVSTLPTKAPISCNAGDVLSLHVTLRPKLSQIDWTITHNGDQTPLQSTFLGAMLRNRDLTRAAVQETKSMALLTVATMASAGEQVAAIEAAVWDEHSAEFPSRETSARFVTEALALQRHLNR